MRSVSLRLRVNLAVVRNDITIVAQNMGAFPVASRRSTQGHGCSKQISFVFVLVSHVFVNRVKGINMPIMAKQDEIRIIFWGRPL